MHYYLLFTLRCAFIQQRLFCWKDYVMSYIQRASPWLNMCMGPKQPSVENQSFEELRWYFNICLVLTPHTNRVPFPLKLFIIFMSCLEVTSHKTYPIDVLLTAFVLISASVYFLLCCWHVLFTLSSFAKHFGQSVLWSKMTWLCFNIRIINDSPLTCQRLCVSTFQPCVDLSRVFTAQAQPLLHLVWTISKDR